MFAVLLAWVTHTEEDQTVWRWLLNLAAIGTSHLMWVGTSMALSLTHGNAAKIIWPARLHWLKKKSHNSSDHVSASAAASVHGFACIHESSTIFLSFPHFSEPELADESTAHPRFDVLEPSSMFSVTFIAPVEQSASRKLFCWYQNMTGDFPATFQHRIFVCKQACLTFNCTEPSVSSCCIIVLQNYIKPKLCHEHVIIITKVMQQGWFNNNSFSAVLSHYGM